MKVKADVEITLSGLTKIDLTSVLFKFLAIPRILWRTKYIYKATKKQNWEGDADSNAYSGFLCLNQIYEWHLSGNELFCNLQYFSAVGKF